MKDDDWLLPRGWQGVNWHANVSPACACWCVFVGTIMMVGFH